MTTQERWKPIAGYEGLYDISDTGRVRRIKPSRGTRAGRILKPQQDHKGYLRIMLYSGVHRRLHKLHNLMTVSFIGPRPSSKEVNHIDGDKLNNRIENLEYVTLAENHRHAARLGLTARGEKQGSHVLTEEDVHKVRARLETQTQKTTARQFGVCQATIGHISTGRNWGWLKSPAGAD